MLENLRNIPVYKMLEGLNRVYLSSRQTYYIFGRHKLSKPYIISTEEELDSVLMHPFGIDSQNDGLAMPRSDFCGRFNDSGKMDI